MSSATPEVRKWFEACGFEVVEQVGETPGTIDRFAVQRNALMAPRTWWVVVESFPSDMQSALNELDKERQARGADRALAIVTSETTPDGYRPNLNAGVVHYVTLRYLALHLSGIWGELHALLSEAALVPELLRRVRLSSGEEIPLTECIDAWLNQEAKSLLTLTGRSAADLRTAVTSLMGERAKQAIDKPDRVTPIVWQTRPSGPKGATALLADQRWVVLLDSWRPTSASTAVHFSTGHLGDSTEEKKVTLVDVSAGELISWFNTAAPGFRADALRALISKSTDLQALLSSPQNRRWLVTALREEPQATEPLEDIARVLNRTFQATLQNHRDGEAVAGLLEDAALKDFALGTWDITEIRDRMALSRFAEETAWINPTAESGSSRFPSRFTFYSSSIRDWFLARRIARATREGDHSIVSRYNFPRQYVLLFLAIMAPEQSALLNEDRSGELRRTIESEVGRRVQLTIAHQLNRSVGAIATHLNSIKRTLRTSNAEVVASNAFSRIEEELAHLRRLTERSRLLEESEAWELTSIPLKAAIDAAIEPLREQHPRVTVDVDIPDALFVRGADDGLREVLHCLLENAFHAVCETRDNNAGHNIAVRARREGETVRVTVHDNGRGIRPEDRERIFDPFVTTKKGGPDQPRGTGLGLSIARKFAERMGGKVELQSVNGETVFAGIFVAGE